MPSRFTAPRPAIEPSREDLIYTAGWWDGEGCFRFHRGSGRPGTGGIECSSTNTYLSMLVWLRLRFGGRVTQSRAATAHTRTQFEWRVTGDNARRFIRLVSPFLKEKAPQARLLLAIPAMPVEQRPAAIERLGALKRVDSARDPQGWHEPP